MGEEKRKLVAAASTFAFGLNSAVYLEEPGLLVGAAHGSINIVTGYMQSQLWPQSQSQGAGAA